MAIKTSTFGGVTLTGGAAKAFKEQFVEAPVKPNIPGQASLEEGRALLKEFKKAM